MNPSYVVLRDPLDCYETNNVLLYVYMHEGFLMVMLLILLRAKAVWKLNLGHMLRRKH